MTWFELAREILNMPFSEIIKPVVVFDYNGEINENVDGIKAQGI